MSATPTYHDAHTGATTAAYVVACTLEKGNGALVLVKNTHVSATMYYKISLYLSNQAWALEYPFLAQTGLAANTLADPITISMPFYKAEISVIQNSGAGTYQVDAITY